MDRRQRSAQELWAPVLPAAERPAGSERFDRLAERVCERFYADGVDATTLEANAAMRSILRRDTGEKYEKFLMRLAKDSRIRTADAGGAGAAGPSSPP